MDGSLSFQEMTGAWATFLSLYEDQGRKERSASSHRPTGLQHWGISSLCTFVFPASSPGLSPTPVTCVSFVETDPSSARCNGRVQGPTTSAWHLYP